MSAFGQLQVLASSPLYSALIASVVMYVWLYLQKTRDKTSLISNSMMTRNAAFVGFLVGGFVFIASRREDFTEKFMVGSLDA